MQEYVTAKFLSVSSVLLCHIIGVSSTLQGSRHGELLNSQQVLTPMQPWPSQNWLFSKNWKLSCPDVAIVSMYTKLTEFNEVGHLNGNDKWWITTSKPDNYSLSTWHAVIHRLYLDACLGSQTLIMHNNVCGKGSLRKKSLCKRTDLLTTLG